MSARPLLARLLAVLAVVALTTPSVELAAEESMDARGAAFANTKFAVDVYKALAATEGNVFFSPISVSLALTMTQGGALGTTAEEMGRVLHQNGAPHPGYGALSRELEGASSAGVDLAIANRLWLDRDLTLAGPFMVLLKEHYKAVFGGVPFVTPEKARETINAWVAKETKDRVKDLLQPGSIDQNTRLVLTNAVTFKGLWSKPFDVASTIEGTFLQSKEKSVQVPFMHQSGQFAYSSPEKGLEVLELPYQGDRLVMMILLPELGGLAQLEEKLSWDGLRIWQKSTSNQKVDVALPKFQSTYDVDLTSVLKGLGMSQAFSPAADFGGIAEEKPLYISLVQHKAFVEVSEEGTEAAAATAVVMTRGAGGHVERFIADRPFIYVIRDTQTNAVLFMGRYVGKAQGE